jgi:hypothetical protein
MPTSHGSRIQTRPLSVARLRWVRGANRTMVHVAEAGWYTLVIAQTNGRALGLGLVRNTLEFERGERAVANNNMRISVCAE